MKTLRMDSFFVSDAKHSAFRVFGVHFNFNHLILSLQTTKVKVILQWYKS